MNKSKIFKTQVDWWYWAILLVCYFFPLYLGHILSWWVSFVLWAVALYIFSLTALVRYVIDGDTLCVFTGFFTKTIIPISSITSIRPSRNPISSLALSLRRLSIRYNKYDEILVSPKDREAFVAALKAANPQILTEN